MSVAKRPPKSRAGKKFLEDRESKIVENTKQVLFMFGQPSSQICKDLSRDLCSITKPNSKVLDRKKECRPFEDVEPLEYLARKNDSSLFAFSTHNKKRPHNMTLGRMFNHKLLGMCEMGVNVKTFKAIKDFDCEGHGIGSKPCMTFSGDVFDSVPEYVQLKSILIDMFKGVVVDNIALSGLDHVLAFTAADGEVAMRHYRIALKKSGTRVPLVELKEMGPRVDWTVRRSTLPAPDLKREAMKQSTQLKQKKRKNLETNSMGDTLGRIHMQAQNIHLLQTRKVKALKKRKVAKAVDTDAVAADDGFHVE